MSSQRSSISSSKKKSGKGSNRGSKGRAEGYLQKLPKDPASVEATNLFLGQLLEELAVLDLEPVAIAAKKALEKARLAKLLGTEDIELVEDAEGNVEFRMEIPPMVSYDEKAGKVRCENAAIAKLIQITTNGDKHAIKKLLSERSTLKAKLLQDAHGWIRLTMLATAVTRAMRPDPRNKSTDWAKLALSMIEEERKQNEKQAPSSGAAQPDQPERNKRLEDLAEFLRAVEGSSHPSSEGEDA